jgi:hypothetical protein
LALVKAVGGVELEEARNVIERFRGTVPEESGAEELGVDELEVEREGSSME